MTHEFGCSSPVGGGDLSIRRSSVFALPPVMFHPTPCVKRLSVRSGATA